MNTEHMKLLADKLAYPVDPLVGVVVHAAPEDDPEMETWPIDDLRATAGKGDRP